MIGTKRVVCVVPARMNSTRFPQKVLQSIQCKAVLHWIFDHAKECSQFDQIIFAVDHPKTAKLIESFGGEWTMTSPECPNGTRRLIEVMKQGKVKGDIWVNWQGDEPFIRSEMIDNLLPEDQLQSGDVWTLKKKIESLQELESPSVVKVVSNAQNHALYFSRYPIPFEREGFEGDYFKHIGLYAYSKNALETIDQLSASELEEREGLEQLGFLYHGLTIGVFETKFESIGIDEPSDLEKAEAIYCR